MKKVLLIALVAVCAMGCCKKNAKAEGQCCEGEKTECCQKAAEENCCEKAATADTTAEEVVIEETVEEVAE